MMTRTELREAIREFYDGRFYTVWESLDMMDRNMASDCTFSTRHQAKELMHNIIELMRQDNSIKLEDTI